MECQSCEVVSINGLYCHEHGCPDAWRDQILTCRSCGFAFHPKERGDTFCDQACAVAYYA